MSNELTVRGLHGLTALAGAQELKGLRALEAEMSRNYDDLTRRFHEHAYRRTFRGRVAAVVGRLFAVYCVVRVVSVSAILIHHHREKPPSSSYAVGTSLVLIGLSHHCRIRKAF